MSHAILITGQTNEVGTLKQYLIANLNDKNFAWSRTTNGGRGESNAWNNDSYSAIIGNAPIETSLVVGAILSTPLTAVDIEAINTNEKPIVLIQKLTKQFGLRDKTISNKTIGEVLTEVDILINTDPTQLAQYRSDGRSDKSATISQSIPTQVAPTYVAPAIVIEHEAPITNASLSFIPSPTNPEIAGYIERTFNGRTETELYDYALTSGENVLLKGDAGTGKTTSAMAYASKRGMKFYSVNFNAGIESSQLFGKIIPSDTGELLWQDGGFTECWRSGNAVINLDELSFMPQKQSSVIHPCLDKRRQLILLDHKGEVIPAGKNLLVVGSYNPDYRGTSKFNEAFADRFSIKLTFDYDTDIERNFIKSETLLTLASQMRAEAISGTYETPISTRLLKNFQKFARELGYDFAVENFLNNFNDEERASVKLLLEAHRFQLEQELSLVNA